MPERATDVSRADRQLRHIAETLDAAEAVTARPWLRGGWAMDFFLGEITREHEDIDWFVWVSDAECLRAELERRGWESGAPKDQQFDLFRDGLESSFALLEEDASGRVVVGGGGRWVGEPFPEALCDDRQGRIGALECPIVSPRGQIQIKRMTPIWIPGRRRRAKDADDIARLEAALDGPMRGVSPR